MSKHDFGLIYLAFVTITLGFLFTSRSYLRWEIAWKCGLLYRITRSEYYLDRVRNADYLALREQPWRRLGIIAVGIVFPLVLHFLIRE